MAKPTFLIIDGYPKASREEFDAAGNQHANRQYAAMLEAHWPEAQSRVWLPSDTAELPDGLGPEEYAGLLWTGCNLTIYHDEDRIHRQIELCKRAYAAGTPQYGSCWGLQMAAVAAGGRVEANPRGREMGLARKIHLTDEGRAHPFYKEKPRVFSAFISHVDRVTGLPPGARVLAENDFNGIQALSIEHERGSFWAVQYHPEYCLHDMARLIVAREPKLVPEGFFQGHTDLMAHVDRFESLAKEPERKDLRWQLDIDDDVLDQTIRQAEFKNWLERLVKPLLASA